MRRWSTSAEIAATRPLLADGGSGLTGEPLGTCARGGALAYDPFAAYGASLVTNPNVLVAGAIGTGKSTVVKMLVARGLRRGSRVAVLDPKGEYSALARHFDGEVVDFSPGSRHGLSPFVGDAATDAATSESFLAVVLERPLTEDERFVLCERFAALSGDDARRPLRALAEDLAGHLTKRSGAPERTLALALRRLVDDQISRDRRVVDQTTRRGRRRQGAQGKSIRPPHARQVAHLSLIHI